MNTYTVQVENFQGPLDKLLNLVKKEELNINQISLAKVTGDFLSYINEIQNKEKINESILADFLVIASKLILIKSKVLIPTLELDEEEEEDIEELEVQLKLYQEIKTAEINIEKKWSEKPKIFTREFLTGSEKIFSPNDVKIEDLIISIKSIIKEVKKIKPVQNIKKEVINLKDKIQDIMLRITDKPTGFKNFFQTGTKGEIVVMFLAVLHLFRNDKINFQQEERFGEIRIHKNNN
jgi:segregation and condensation protein A